MNIAAQLRRANVFTLIQMRISNICNCSRISVITMAGVAIVIDDVSVTDTILDVKERVFELNPKLYVRRQRLVYSAGPHGIHPLSDELTLRGAGVPQDGSAKLDVLLADVTAAEAAELGDMVQLCLRYFSELRACVLQC